MVAKAFDMFNDGGRENSLAASRNPVEPKEPIFIMPPRVKVIGFYEPIASCGLMLSPSGVVVCRYVGGRKPLEDLLLFSTWPVSHERSVGRGLARTSLGHL